MKTLSLAIFILAPLVFAQDAKFEKVGTSPVEAHLASGGHIRMDLCSSGIDLVGTDEKTMRVSYEPERGDVKVRMQVSGDRAQPRSLVAPRPRGGHDEHGIRRSSPGADAGGA